MMFTLIKRYKYCINIWWKNQDKVKIGLYIPAYILVCVVYFSDYGWVTTAIFFAWYFSEKMDMWYRVFRKKRSDKKTQGKH